MLVDAASVAFLFAFATVDVIAIQSLEDGRRVTDIGIVLSLVTRGGAVWYLLQHEPVALEVLAALIMLAVFGRPQAAGQGRHRG